MNAKEIVALAVTVAFLAFVAGVLIGADAPGHCRALTGQLHYRLDKGRIVCQVVTDAPETGR